MDVYLAGRYSIKNDLKGYRDVLVGLGHTVTAQWLDRVLADDERDRVHALRAAGGDEESHEMARPWAVQDFEDVCRSNCLIWFAPGGRRGGSHVEMGMGIALNLRCIVVGPVENVFHSLPQVERYPSFEEMVARFLTEPENGWVQPSTVMRSYLDLL